jgi:large subunit ribosomal protein L10
MLAECEHAEQIELCSRPPLLRSGGRVVFSGDSPGNAAGLSPSPAEAVRDERRECPVPTNEKQELVAEIKERFEKSDSVILVDYRGLTVKEMQELRSKTREAGAEIRVYKNTLTQIAVRELDLPNMDAYLEGPTAFVFTGEDPVAPAKAMSTFMREHAALEFKGGFVQNALVDAEAIKAIAKLPSRDELIA